MNLTPKQLRIFEFIKDFRDEHSYAPTLEEIAVNFSVSKITVLQHLRALEKRGAIRRSRYQARSIEVREPSRGRKRRSQLPLVGVIAAGLPIEAIEDRELFDMVELIEGKDEPFLLRVRGDSMIDEQIRDGDFVICERRTAAHNGETVVAVLEDEEATLKKFYRERGGRVRLEPANPTMKPFYPKQVEVRGVVVGVLRKY
jgi:repressor LexA